MRCSGATLPETRGEPDQRHAPRGCRRVQREALASDAPPGTRARGADSRCTRAMRGRWWSHRLTVATHWRGREVTNSNSCDLPFGASVQVASSLNLRSPQT